jgi:hypothetical protein
MAKRPILHATDFSSASRRAFAKAIELAKGSRSELLVLHVLNPMIPMIGDRPIDPPTYTAATSLADLGAETAGAIDGPGQGRGRPGDRHPHGRLGGRDDHACCPIATRVDDRHRNAWPERHRARPAGKCRDTSREPGVVSGPDRARAVNDEFWGRAARRSRLTEGGDTHSEECKPAILQASADGRRLAPLTDSDKGGERDLLPAFVGAGLVYAGVTDRCGMAMLLAKLPYNRRGADGGTCAAPIGAGTCAAPVTQSGGTCAAPIDRSPR